MIVPVFAKQVGCKVTDAVGAGIFKLTANVLAVELPHSLTATTLILAAAVPTVTVIEFEFCPEVIAHPEAVSTVQLYDEALATVAIL